MMGEIAIISRMRRQLRLHSKSKPLKLDTDDAQIPFTADDHHDASPLKSSAAIREILRVTSPSFNCPRRRHIARQYVAFLTAAMLIGDLFAHRPPLWPTNVNVRHAPHRLSARPPSIEISQHRLRR